MHVLNQTKSNCRPLIFLFALTLLLSCETATEDKVPTYETFYEKSKGTETATYQETIEFYIGLAKDFPEINVQTIGETDSGYPLHLVTFNPDGDFNFEHVRAEKATVLINNGIHPGESDGIDATMMLFRDLAIGKMESPKNVVLATIPIYNIGGALQRNSTTRVNQNGPVHYGFRGNARNYDLNRDFVKMDTKNAKTFAQIFHLVKPDVFVDNHVSNGADYQYILTHLFTQHNKLGGKLGKYLEEVLRPQLEESLADKDWDITPYVNVFNRPPELGFSQFMDHPRYSTGYTTLWNTLGMMVETHMLKPYEQRVEGTYELMESMISIVEKEYKTIKKLREETAHENLELEKYHFNWQVDRDKGSALQFKGYEAAQPQSEITGHPRLQYQRDKPFTKETTYHNHFFPVDTITVPAAYIIPKSWIGILERLEANGIDYFELGENISEQLETYTISSYETRQSPYEGHYPHYNTIVEQRLEQVQLMSGDLVVPTNQEGVRYLLETLEPQADDSFFNWNFFDTVLQQKEGFSPYVFEDLALEILQKDSVLRTNFLAKKELDEEFAQNWYAQLDWVFQRSKYREKPFLRYPIYRIAKGSKAEDLIPKE
ncbi:M14 family metallopeptidase [Flagellimonas myxillae]|uniref:M14 family metallopeptidase n=1 Tax=Flagellimonas myxillae TaxID=2942214 RepID=UPI00201E9518|nr:M14 family metallopeptidase [Muricauda myxillae]MCL6268014.1 M14 family metallopeptidase [Muricauda myxillae]